MSDTEPPEPVSAREGHDRAEGEMISVVLIDDNRLMR